MNEFDFRVPDVYGEPRRLWRGWRITATIVDGKPEIKLHSINQMIGDSQPFSWKPREIMQGVCNKRPPAHSDEETPMEKCQCGIHALTSPLFLSKTGYVSMVGKNRASYIWGEIDTWGKIIEGTTGLKAQFGYPASFVLRWDLTLDYLNEKNELVVLDSLTIKDILSQQWGIPAIVATSAYREPKPRDGVIFKEYEPE